MVYAGEFIGYNITVTETVDPQTDQLRVGCAVWAYPQPDVTLMIDNTVSTNQPIRARYFGQVTGINQSQTLISRFGQFMVTTKELWVVNL